MGSDLAEMELWYGKHKWVLTTPVVESRLPWVLNKSDIYAFERTNEVYLIIQLF